MFGYYAINTQKIKTNLFGQTTGNLSSTCGKLPRHTNAKKVQKSSCIFVKIIIY